MRSSLSLVDVDYGFYLPFYKYVAWENARMTDQRDSHLFLIISYFAKNLCKLAGSETPLIQAYVLLDKFGFIIQARDNNSILDRLTQISRQNLS
jgi:hypothetical protein